MEKLGKKESWFSVEPLDSESWILGVSDFNLEEKHKEKRQCHENYKQMCYRGERGDTQKCAW